MPLILDIEQIEKLESKRRARRLKKGQKPVKAESTFRKRMEKLWEQTLIPITSRIEQAIRLGASQEFIGDLIQEALRSSEFVYNVSTDEIITLWQLSLDKDTRRIFEASLKGSLGVDIRLIQDSPAIKEAMAVGFTEASQTIKSIPTQHLGQIAKAVADNYWGVPLPEGRSLLGQIKEIGKVSRNKAKLIARDQTSKMNSRMVQIRQQDIGIDEYIWHNVRDQRVVGNPTGLYPTGNKAHGNHWVMEGKYCRWDDSTLYSTDKGKTWVGRTPEMPKTHPGIDIQCRCYAEAVIDLKKILAMVEEA